MRTPEKTRVYVRLGTWGVRTPEVDWVCAPEAVALYVGSRRSEVHRRVLQEQSIKTASTCSLY